MAEESQDQANKCHHMAVNLRMVITVQEHPEDLLGLMVDTRVHSMEDLVTLPQVHIRDTRDLLASNTMVLGHKEVQDGLLIQVVLRLIQKEE